MQNTRRFLTLISMTSLLVLAAAIQSILDRGSVVRAGSSEQDYYQMQGDRAHEMALRVKRKGKVTPQPMNRTIDAK